MEARTTFSVSKLKSVQMSNIVLPYLSGAVVYSSHYVVASGKFVCKSGDHVTHQTEKHILKCSSNLSGYNTAVTIEKNRSDGQCGTLIGQTQVLATNPGDKNPAANFPCGV